MNIRDAEDAVAFDGKLPNDWLIDAIATYALYASQWGHDAAAEAICEGFELSAAHENEFLNSIKRLAGNA